MAPTANAGGPYTGTASSAVTFNGSGSYDPQDQTLTYNWSFGDGGVSSGSGDSKPTHYSNGRHIHGHVDGHRYFEP